MFTISNAETNVVKYILYEFHECTTSGYENDLISSSSDTENSKCSSLGCHFTEITSYSTDHLHFSRTKERVFKSNESISTLLKPMFVKNYKSHF